MQPRVLLVNPPIYDFSAYDFWLKPYGMLRVAGYMRGQADLTLFDYLDRHHPTVDGTMLRSDGWGRGEFPSRVVAKPAQFSRVPRRYRRYGLDRRVFQEFLTEQPAFDVTLVQTVMTYWYPGVSEVLEDLRRYAPKTRIVLGGVYATLCPEHARGLGADLVVEGARLEPLWEFLNLTPRDQGLPFWEGYSRLDVGVLKLAQGCPFRCTYCSVPVVEPRFRMNVRDQSLAELEFLCSLGVRHVAFYDDALLYRADEMLAPFLEQVRRGRFPVEFHTPNALNARFITQELAELMVAGGLRSFFLGFESNAYDWQRRTGGKVYSEEFVRAVEHLTTAGADRSAITAYLIVGHPNAEQQAVEASMRFVHDLGIRVMLAEFSPIPGTPDGELCRQWVDLSEPLSHNKTAFAFASLGDEANRLKLLSKQLNKSGSRQSAVGSRGPETAK